jgi:peptidoglycan/LPS O-acetylase OafA/YrhL
VGLGGTGVDLFFVLSGFLITGILIRSKSSSPHYFLYFYGRRVVRIFPLYYAFLVIYFCFVNRTSAEQLHYWLYVSNWKTAFGVDFATLAHFWSLSIEEQFYFAWPLIVYFVPAKALPRACIILTLSSTLLRFPLALTLPVKVLNELTFFRLDGLGVGALIAACVATGGIPDAIKLRAGRLAAVCLTSTVFIHLGAVTNAAASLFRSTMPWLERFDRAVFPLLISLAFGALMIECIFNDGILAWIMRFPWLRSFGKYSYGIYIIHYPISLLFKPRAGIVSLMMTEIVGIALSYGAALISWNILEKHCLKLKRYFETSSSVESACAASVGS